MAGRLTFGRARFDDGELRLIGQPVHVNFGKEDQPFVDLDIRKDKRPVGIDDAFECDDFLGTGAHVGLPWV